MATFMWQRRRRITLAAMMIFAAATIWMSLRSSESALATSGGDPYEVPLAVDTNGDPDIFETTLTAEEAVVDIGNGVMATALTYNGQLPGPELRFKVGDTVIIHFHNNIGHASGIHWHGIELNNASDGTPLTQNMVPPGGSFLYQFKVTRPGVYWYHPHHHSSTNQVFKGLYGSLVITDPHEAALQAGGTLPSAAQTRTVVLSDATVCKAAGSNDAVTFPLSLPWRDGTAGAFPGQGGPHPVTICETSAIDEDGNARPAHAAGAIPNIQTLAPGIAVNEGQTVLTNGKNVGARAGTPAVPGALSAGASVLDLQPGQGLRLQLVNTATTRFFRLRLTDGGGGIIPLVRIGGQGGLLDQAVVEGGVDPGGFDTKFTSGEILLDPGDRADVVAAIPSGAGGDTLTMWTLDFQRIGAGSKWANVPTVPVMHLNVTGATVVPAYTIAGGTLLRSAPAIADPVEVIGPPTGVLLDPSTFTPAELGTPNQNIRLTNNESGGPGLGINNVTGIHDFPGDFTLLPHVNSTRYASLGTTLELTVTNTTSAHHPFHLHGFSIQPISLTDSDPGDADGTKPPYTFPYREFRDNIDVPAKYTLTFRVRLDDRPMMDGVTPGGGVGRWVFHCHIFFHATFGMLSEFVVLPSTNAPPTIAANAASVTVNEGQTAVMTGTYSDPDGDPVTLGASVGTIIDNGGGTWSWSFATTDGPAQSQTVSVTASDAGGAGTPATFALGVNNLPPSAVVSSPANGTLFQLADAVPVIVSFSDPGTGDTHTCSISWGDGVTTAGVVVEVAGAGTCTGSHTYSLGGLKTIKAKVTDDDGASDVASVTVDINTPPDCNPVMPSPLSLWPANHKLITVSLSGATDADGDTVTLSVNFVTQDEALNGTGDGDTAPDAALVAGQSHQVRLRAERSGNGDGRVYRLLFTGDDGRGGTCTATKTVSVPHSPNKPAVDSGLNIPSM